MFGQGLNLGSPPPKKKHEICILDSDKIQPHFSKDLMQVLHFCGYYRFYIAIKQIDSFATEWDAILLPFTSRLWIAITLVTVKFAVALAVTYHLKRRHENEVIEDFSLVNATLIFAGILCQQGKIFRHV
jgi:hypothetical protein